MTDARIEAGRELVRDMFGEDFLAAIDAARGSGGFGAEAAAFALGSAFGDFWTRPGIDRKTRSMVTMSMIMGLRTSAEFKNHVRGALNNGCTVSEIEEVIYQGIPYLGFPTVAVALQAAGEVIAERGLLPVLKQPEVR